MTPKLLLCLLIIAHSSFITCKDVYINSTALSSLCTATPSCSFLDPSLWNDNVPPATNDMVYIIDAPDNTFLVLNSSLSLSQLMMTGTVTLLVESGQLTASNVSLSNSTISLTGSSTMISTYSTFLLERSVIEVDGTGGYLQSGSLFYAGRDSQFNLMNGYLYLDAAEARLQGQLTIMPNVTFDSSSDQTYFENRTFIFLIEPVISNAIFWNSNVTFNQGWSQASNASLVSSTVTIFDNALDLPQTLSHFNVDSQSTLAIRGVSDCYLNATIITGTLYISSSSVTIAGSFNAPLVLGGQSILNVDSLVLKSVTFTVGEYGEPENVNITTSILHTFGNVILPHGVIQINQYAYFSGSFMTDGTVMANGHVYVDGVFFVKAQVRIATTPINTNLEDIYTLELDDAVLSTFNLSIGDRSVFKSSGSTINCDHIAMNRNSSLIHRNSTFVGNIVNEGHIAFYEYLNWAGNFTQGVDGLLEFGGLNLPNRTTTGRLVILGDAILDGTISYSVSLDSTQNGKLQVVVLNASKILGKFKSNPVNVGMDISSKSSVEYSDSSVYLVFENNQTKNKKTEWYIWLLVAIGCTIAVAVPAWWLVMRRKRAEYAMVPA